MTDPELEESADGRTARRDRNRDAVLDAVLELFAEDSLTPGPAEVADRSGVSLRSVYRYFEDMDALVRAAIARHLVRMAPLFELDHPGEGPVEERIEAIVTARLRLYEAAAPMARASVARAQSNRIIRERLEETRKVLQRQVEDMFAPELAARPKAERAQVAASLDVLLELEALEHLRRYRALPEPAVQEILVRAVRALLGVSA
ncbi:TetR/AcrR family transcriptional regulator [Aquihabitans sp. McL0605]|uniref:TetR/AcrR family transcriptional regulator n=1 Tax=Aquihabitans sp. McL0605 TaxID=3415671 RepID=UPI003CECB7C0